MSKEVQDIIISVIIFLFFIAVIALGITNSNGLTNLDFVKNKTTTTWMLYVIGFMFAAISGINLLIVYDEYKKN